MQIKLRQEAMLKKASYPPRMQSELIKKKLQENVAARETRSAGPRRPREKKTELDRLYREYRENLERKQKLIEDMDKETLRIDKMKVGPRPLQRRAVSGEVESTTNLTTKLRLEVMQERRLREEYRKQKEAREEQVREERERNRRKNNPVWENIQRDLGSSHQTELERLKRERMEEDKRRMREYKVELEKMIKRVENQPTLFQKQSQVWIICDTF